MATAARPSAPPQPGSDARAELARAHGGTLTADSQPGKGTTLTLRLPRA